MHSKGGDRGMMVSARLAIYRPAPLNPARPRPTRDARLRKVNVRDRRDETPATPGAVVRSKTGGSRQRPRLGGALGLEQVRQQERQIDRLLGVEPGIADGVIAVLEVRVGDHAGAAGALDGVLTGHLQLHASAVSACGAVDREEGLRL